MSLEMHKKTVEALRKELAHSFAQKQSVSISRSTGQSNTTRSGKYKEKTRSLSAKNFNKILRFDPQRRSILVEPRITMEELVNATLAQGLIPEVVPEFKGITVGGAVMGAAIESSSHAHGQFNDICLAFEMLLGDGTLIQASRNENSDLFYGISGSYGAFGFLTSVEIALAPACESITLTYKRYNDMGSMLNDLRMVKNEKNPPDYIEGILFTEKHGLIIEGRPSGPADLALKEASTTKFWDQWFVQHARQINADVHKERMPLRDYLFRYDRGAFWMGYYALHPQFLWRHLLKRQLKNLRPSKKELSSFPKDPLSAVFLPRLLGSMMGSQQLYSSLHAVPESWFSHSFVVQDFYIPEANVEKFIGEEIKEAGIFPLWLCPMRGTSTRQFLAPHYCNRTLNQFINVGVYGIPKNSRSPRQATADLEELASSLGGRKMLYSQSYYTPEKFWEIYPYEDYQRLRELCHADGVFLPLDQKVLSILAL